MTVDQDEIHRLALSENTEDRLNAVKILKDKFKSLPDKHASWDSLYLLANDSSSDVKKNTASAIGYVFPSLPDKSNSWESLYQLSNDIDFNVRRNAASAIGRAFSSLPDKHASWKALHRLLSDEDSGVRKNAASAIGPIFSLVLEEDKPNVFDSLCKLANDSNSHMRAVAASAFGTISFSVLEVNKSNVSDYLNILAHDNNSDVRKKTASAIGRAFSSFPDEHTSWNLLHELLNDDNSAVRMNAASAIGNAYSSILEEDKLALWESLHILVHDTSLDVRKVTASTIGHLFSSLPNKLDAWKDLYKLALDKYLKVRQIAATMLFSAYFFMHEDDKNQALNDLISLMNNDDLNVQKTTNHGLSLLVKQTSTSKDIQDLIVLLMGDTDPSDATDYFPNNKFPKSLLDDYKTIIDFQESTKNDSHYPNVDELNDSSIKNKLESPFINGDASVPKANVSDQRSKEDFLGFEPYVQAIYEFLSNPSTKAPLTLSIEGPWGIGKSSFMAQLKDKFGDNALTVEFNPWRHDKEDALWAFFAIEFVNQLKGKQKKPCQKVKSYLRLFWYRINWNFETFKFLLIYFIIPISTSIYLYLNLGQSLLATFAPLIPISVPLFGIFKQVQENINPLASDFKKCSSSPDYGKHVSFIEHFHEDFKKIVDAYTANRNKDEKIYVFIDDLDRCEIPKAADLLQALNLMIASDPRIIFIIGLDRMKVAAGLAVKYESILPYLNSQSCGIELDNEFSRKSMKGLEFGYEFIEKFIQVPFSVPVPDNINIKKLIEEMSSKDADSKDMGTSTKAELEDEITRVEAELEDEITRDEAELEDEITRDEAELEDEITRDEAELEDDIASLEIEKERSEIKSEVTRDSEKIRAIALMVSSALDNNPRRMKQFINVFRLRVFIAVDTGLLDEGSNLTLEQLGKFVAISLKWPLLIANLDDHPDLLGELHRITIDSENENNEEITKFAEHWKSEKKLLDLLKYGCDAESGEAYSLESLDVKQLLKVSPKTAIKE